MQDGAAEAELLLKAGRGDEAAFLLLYERHRTPVFRFACRMLGSAPQAEDVTQECFLQILRRPEAFRPERASLRTYLCAIARHLALKLLRKRGQETAVDDPPEEAAGGSLAAAGRDPLSTAIDAEAAEMVRAAVEGLPPLQREAVVLFEYQEMSLADIAAVCDTDVGTVKSRLHRARERLRRTLTPLLLGGAHVKPAGRETRP
ncbi:MAG TPA: RNA polymerase sigma factor [Vicinamibacteria bacterium]|nr:RNA polymerase sigma factor [Vicinamibacteria bacterium]